MQIFPPARRFPLNSKSHLVDLATGPPIASDRSDVPFIWGCGAKVQPPFMTNVHMPTENGRTARDDQHWLWTVHCPDCLTTKSLVREDFDGAERLFSDAARVDTRRNSRILSSLPMLFPNPPQSRRYYRTSRTAQSATIQNGGSLTTSGECGFSSGKFDVSLTFPSGSRLRAHTFQSRHCCFGTVSRVELRFLACGHAGPRAFPHLGIVMVPNISLKHGFTIVTT